jgi:hypothetical protein
MLSGGARRPLATAQDETRRNNAVYGETNRGGFFFVGTSDDSMVARSPKMRIGDDARAFRQNTVSTFESIPDDDVIAGC